MKSVFTKTNNLCDWMPIKKIRPSPSARVLLGALAVFAVAVVPAHANACLRVVFDENLPSDLEWPFDLRWPQEDRIVLALPFKGLYGVDIDIGDGIVDAGLLIANGNGRAQIRRPVTMAASENSVILAAPYHVYGVGKLRGSGLEELYTLADINDVDLHNGKILLFGAQRDDENRYAADGAIAWLGELEQDPSDMKPVFYSSSGPGAHNASACGMLETGNVRFLHDGSFVIAPGFEPDVYLYDPDGKLLGTWTSEAVGFDGECGLSEKEMYRLSKDEPGRWAWVNQRRTVDEILPLPDGPGLLVRTARGDATAWQLKRLRPGGGVDTCEVPIEATSNLARIKGDVRGDRIALLLRYNGYTRETPHPPRRPRLLLLRYMP